MPDYHLGHDGLWAAHMVFSSLVVAVNSKNMVHPYWFILPILPTAYKKPLDDFSKTSYCITKSNIRNTIIMHLSEGIVSLPILLGGGVLAALGTTIGLKRLHDDHIIATALLSSAFFVASLIHVPLGPASVHLILNGLVGILLGWASVPAIAIALLLQALLFGYGGLTVLGVNIVIMALPAVVVSLLFRPLVTKPGKYRLLGGFLAGASAILLSTILLALALIGTDSSFLVTARILLLSQLPLMLIEGVITMFVLAFLARVQPELLHLNNPA